MKTKFQFRDNRVKAKWERKQLHIKLRTLKFKRFDLLKERRHVSLTEYQTQELQFLNRKIANVEKLLR